MSHCHDHGFSCSCSNPMWKSLFPYSMSLTLKIEAKPKPTEDKIFYAKDGGTIITLEGGENVQVEAIAVKNGKIADTGSLDHITSKHKDINTFYPITKSETLIPSFIDPHTHIIPSAVMNIGIDLSPFDGQDLRTNTYHRKLIANKQTDQWALKNDYSRDWVIQTLQKEVDRLNEKPGDTTPILGHNVDPSLLIGEKEFNADILNQVIDTDTKQPTKHPIYITNTSGHIAYINSSAIDTIEKHNAGIKGDAKKVSVGTNGILKEMDEMIPAVKVLFENDDPDFNKILSKKISEQIQLVIDTAVSRGVTYLYDAGLDTTGPQIKMMKDLALQENAKVRLGGALLVSNLDQLQNEIIGQYQPGKGTEHFNIASLKLVSDGSAQGLTAYQSTPYDCNENYTSFSLQAANKTKLEKDNNILHQQNNTGLFNYGYPVEFNALIDMANNYNWPVMIHANGDHAIERCLSAFKASGLTKKTKEQRRNRIEHCSLLTPEKLETMQQLGISPSFTIGHIGYWGWLFKYSAIGENRANQLDLCRSALNDYDMRISFHSDYSVTPVGGLRMMEQSITRVMEGAPYLEHKTQVYEVLNEAQTLTPFQALKAVTYDAAWHCHADQWVGSLEVNKCADFVILEQSPLDYYNKDAINPAEGMRNIPVLSTWKGGECVYYLGQFPSPLPEGQSHP